jgi:hypothetical protein
MKTIIIAFISILIYGRILLAQDNGGLVGMYPFNGNANDESGNGKNGVVYGATLTDDRFGNDSSAFFFDGINDYIDLPYYYGDVPEFSISLWFYIVNLVTNQEITGIVGPSGNSFIQLQISPGNIVIYTDGYGSFSLQGLQAEPLGVWRHVVLSVKSGDTRVYQNAELIAQQSAEFYNITGPTSWGLRIGSSSYYGRWLNGMIDDLRLYERALNESEIRTLYYEGGWDAQARIKTVIDNQLTCKNDSTIFEVVAGGIPPICYQWQKNGIDILGATDSILIIPLVQAEYVGEYRCIATNDFGTDTSNTAKLNLEFATPTDILGPANVLKSEFATYSILKQEGHTYEFLAEGGSMIDGTKNSVTVHWGAAGKGFVRLLEISEQGCIADTNTLSVSIGSLGIDDQETHNRSVYPNPFKGTATFYYTLTEPSQVTLQIYNAYGKLIDTPVNTYQYNGNHQAQWNAGNLPAGIYFYRLTTGDTRQTANGKLLVVK